MKEKLNIKALYTLLPVLGLALLLLLSPCKVRNFIQTELGIPQTEISNKNKTSFSSSNCSDVEISNLNSVEENSLSQQLPAILVDFALVFSLPDITKSYTTHYQTRRYSASSIPLYILYQNFKDYL